MKLVSYSITILVILSNAVRATLCPDETRQVTEVSRGIRMVQGRRLCVVHGFVKRPITDEETPLVP